jgi:DNA-binding beta-propeller fold protein YncE
MEELSMKKTWLFALGMVLLLPPGFGQLLKPTLREVLSLGSVDEDYFSQWAGIAVDKSGAIYVVDRKDCLIRKFDESGRFVKKTGRKGQGPGEFDSPVKILAHQGRLYVTQLYKPGFMLFDLDLKYLGLLPTTFSISDFVVLEDGRIVVSSLGIAALEGKSGSFLYFLSDKAEIEKKVAMPGEGSASRFDSWNLALDGRSAVMAVDNWTDRVVKLDRDGRILFLKKPLGLKTPKPKELEIPKEMGTFAVPTELLMKSVQFDSRNRAYILRGSLTENPSRDVLILDTDGRIIGNLTLPEKSHLIYIDSRDFLYYRSEEGLTVKKAKIE